MTAKVSSAGILGTGYYVPEKVLTNFDLEKMVDTNDEWIVERTGIRERRIAEKDVPVSELAYRAAVMALEDAGVAADELDLIIVLRLLRIVSYHRRPVFCRIVSGPDMLQRLILPQHAQALRIPQRLRVSSFRAEPIGRFWSSGRKRFPRRWTGRTAIPAYFLVMVREQQFMVQLRMVMAC